MPANEGRTGFLAVFAREFSHIRQHARYPLAMFVFPLLSFILIWGLFSEPYPRELPVAVVDLDHSKLSRSLIRAVDASPEIRVAFQAADPVEAKNLMLEGAVYAWLHIPKALEKDILEGKGGDVTGFINTQMLLPGSMVSSSLQATVSTLSAGLNIRSRMQGGAMPEKAMDLLDPVRIDRHVLFNPQLNYMYFLSAALCPTFLQIFVLMVTVMALGSEFKNRTAEHWLKTAGGSVWWAITGKLAVYFLCFSLVGLIMLAVIFPGFGVPLRGSCAVLMAGTLILILAYMACALVLVYLFPSLRMALSAASFFSGTAFAFVGITFPVEGMPALGKAWSSLLPLTHYLHLFQEQTLRQAPISLSVPDLLIMLGFVGAGYCLIPFFKRHMTDSRYWGKA
ncbi:ABC transporter permease [Desulfotignum phosphitoxidans]|uniref:ABC-type multidrug transport system, permease component, MdtB n=1 Tax=Desulfotignum phosphitoxidans DSM 13687 TaxID=1286635 RepID=S0G065_9BACT|nr:ABC transporter permease [Desulfotignum phosphitoxidans]EMS78834.1 ABC-type multidrug transport system, permease component, MdtB [Desulfotignum phosphitoxidans DSM 13687]